MIRRLFIVCALALTVLTIPGSSAADLNWCAEVIAPEPQRINASVLGADTEEWRRFDFDDPDFDPTEENEDPRGVYGSYGMAGQFWHTIKSKDCFDDTRLSFKHEIASLTWSATKGINTWVLRIFGWATSDELNEIFTPLVVDVMTSLRDSMWRPLIPLAVTVGAIWMAWVGLVRKRFTLSAQGAVWMVSAMLLGFWILFSPNTAITTATSVVDVGGGAVNAAVNQVSSDGTATDCPGGSSHHVTQRGDESWSAFQARETREMVWTALQCRPWQAGVFGSDKAGQEAADQYGYSVLRAQSVANGAPQERIDSKKEYFERIAEAVEEEHPEVWLHFRGSMPEERLNIAFASLTGSVLGGLPLGIIGIALMVFKMAFLVGALFSPIFLLLGIAPGPGRRLLGQYGVVMGGIIIAQIALLLILLVTALSYGMIWSQDLDLGQQIIAMLVLFLGMIAFWAPLWKIVRGAAGGQRQDLSSLGAPTPLASATRRSADMWRYRSKGWMRRQGGKVARLGDREGPSAATRVAGTSVSPDKSAQAPDLTQGQEEKTQRLARGRGAVRPTTPEGQQARQSPSPRESGGYRGQDRSPEHAPPSSERHVETRRSEETRKEADRVQRHEVEVLRSVRAAEVGPAEQRRDPSQAPPHPAPRPTPHPAPGPRPSPRPSADTPSGPPVRRRP